MILVVPGDDAPRRRANIAAWLCRHCPLFFHGTPTPGSWLNAVEGLFDELTARRFKRGVYRSIGGLIETAIHAVRRCASRDHGLAAINRFLDKVNDNSGRFSRTANRDKIIAALVTPPPNQHPPAYPTGPNLQR